MQWKMREALGALPDPCVLGDPAPLNPPGPCPGWGDRAGCGGEGGRGGRLANSRRPQDRAPALPLRRAGERWRRLWRGEGRACSCGREGHAQIPRACVRACAGLARPPPSLLGAGRGGERGPRAGRPRLLDDEAAGQVLREVLEELGGGSGAVGQLQLLQVLQLHQARQPGGGQQRAACGGAGLSGRGPDGARLRPLAGWDLRHRESTPGVGLHEGPGSAGGVGLGGGEWPLPKWAAQGLTCQRQETQTPHGQEVLQPEVLHLGGKAGRVSYFRSRLEGAPLLASGHRGRGLGSQVPTESLRALGTPCAPLGCEGIPDFLTGSEWAGCRSVSYLGGGFPHAPPTSPAYSPVWRRGGLIPGSTIAGRGCGGTTWWTNS